MANDLERAAADIAAALAAGNILQAERDFTTTVAGSKFVLVDLCKLLAATVDVPAGTVAWGASLWVWANPMRTDYAWRCGSCEWTGSGYKTPHGTEKAATKHAGEHDPTLELLHLRPAN